MKVSNCYHCGQPIPTSVDLAVNIDGQPRAMCCGGCQAVAQTIVDNGLTDYYRHRDTLPNAPHEALPEIVESLRFYDHADFQKGFVRDLDGGPDSSEREASLILEGITCSACIWLNEQQLCRLAGVTAVDINYATRRARVRWDERRIKLSDILAAISAIGYRAYPYDTARSEELARQERRGALWRVFVAGFGMMQVMMYAVPVYFAGAGEMMPAAEQLLRWASLVLTVPVVCYSAAPFFRNAWRDLRLHRAGMDVPVALGVGAAFAASVWATLTASGEVYFDSVTMFVFFLLSGRFLEMTARQRAVSVTEALARLMPVVAARVSAYPASRDFEQVMAADLQRGDVVLVRPGETIPADGQVIEGESSASEALLTGESAPVQKRPGVSVTAGAVNIESPLLIEVTQVGDATRLSAIVRLMERAASEKPRIVELADRIASHFIVTLLFLAAAVALAWWFIDPRQMLWITVSVLVVTCPCALSLATPVALTVASGAMARIGLLVTHSHAVESLAQASHFVFDKTGTLTTGEMQVLEILPLGRLDQQDSLALAAALEQASEHPIAAALRQATGGKLLPAVDEPSNEPGSGMNAQNAGRSVRLGRPDYVQVLHGKPLPDAAQSLLTSSDTVIALGDESDWIALFRLGDKTRPEAAAMVAALRAGGRQVALLTGDAAPAAHRVAQALGIDEVLANASPQAKHDYVRHLQANGAVVAMVGDGVNDAPVLAQAQVSVAMGGGSQLARTQADLVLLSENLDHLWRGVVVARRTLHVIRQNLLWSFAYNLVALPLAMSGFITPWMAGIGMSGSSLLVVANSLRLQKGCKG
ncbi:MAG: heavy metal translocating P-type ATPase [Candidatus Accumulibacter phosphatis]|uniref:Heavy metal translocating P-type ATPase n=2 Tax=Candidatus Accumulibacter TaxID=327159 RepID=A0A7D5SI71_9PROT|nr:heavy metal translocating P-type ATPase [Accumulibacter sp.]MCC2868240.1 heavy metal translocating P-type ATPase [Candidatus Accumulibacter phosphatis]QLH52282.1 MAG: heavy metal translocating P-type ATPase [Candidatus Accumulibacter cognatus]MBN8517435.1 heavy metal translocating P-type ATPase [Accumulibacter sp.]MBO3710631.1 heavy metal translocating P-type ATPase [Accumulibacter sp.]MCM8581054.1 heavy metal translocating P-type ATPase [Accumulibacter sp.]